MNKLSLLIMSLVFSGALWAADYSKPDVAISARQNQFEDIKASVNELRFELIKKAPDLKKARQHAVRLSTLSQPLIEMFRVRSAQGASKALDRIWDNWPRFERQMEQFIELTEQADESLRYANTEDARMYVDQIAKSCKSCHRLFKAR